VRQPAAAPQSMSRQRSPIIQLCARSMPSFTLVPKVSAALWGRMREAKLRFGVRRVSRGIAFDVVVRRKGDGVSPG
jgi:hypothetical protein